MNTGAASRHTLQGTTAKLEIRGFYDLLTTEWLILDDGIRVQFPHLSEPSLRAFHDVVTSRYREYLDAYEAAGGFKLARPDNQVSGEFVERVLGVDVSTVSGTSRFLLLGEIHVRILSFSKTMSVMEAAL